MVSFQYLQFWKPAIHDFSPPNYMASGFIRCPLCSSAPLTLYSRLRQPFKPRYVLAYLGRWEKQSVLWSLLDVSHWGRGLNQLLYLMLTFSDPVSFKSLVLTAHTMSLAASHGYFSPIHCERVTLETLECHCSVSVL